MKPHLLAAIMLPVCASVVAVADLPQATDSDRAEVRAAIQRVTAVHLTKPVFDAGMIGKGIDAYVELLDPAKNYFTTDDIREFTERRTELLKGFRNGDLSVAYRMYRRYQQRRREYATEAIRQLKAGKFDFSRSESRTIDNETRTYRQRADELSNRVRLYNKHSLLDAKAEQGKDFDLATACRHFSFAWQRRLNAIQTESVAEVNSYFLNCVFAQLDPHTTYTGPKKPARTGSFFGIGASLTAKDEGLIVDRVLPNGPAARDGRLQAGDRIVEIIKSGSFTPVDIRLMPIAEAIELIVGKEGTTVRLVVKRGAGKLRVIEIKRGRVQVDTEKIRSQVLTAGRGPRERKVGLISIPSLYKLGISSEVREILVNFNKQNVDVVVLDMRNNGGGYLREAVAVTELFVTQGPILQVRGRESSQTVRNTATKPAWDKSLVVLVNRNTGSGVELFSAAIQDYSRGLIVGDEVTAGAGTIGNEQKSPAGGAIRVTVQQFYRVNGASTQRRGVQPDVVLPSRTGIFEPNANSGKIAFDRMPDLPRTNQQMLTPEILEVLNSRSTARRSGIPEFTKLTKAARQLLSRMNQVTISLDEKKFMANWRTRQLDLPPKPKPGERDFYLNEVLTIAADYDFQLKGKRPTTAPKLVSRSTSSRSTSSPSSRSTPTPRRSPPAVVQTKPAPSPKKPTLRPSPRPSVSAMEQRAAKRRQVRRKIVDLERDITNTKSKIQRYQKEIAYRDNEIAKNNALMRRSSFAERLVIASVNIAHINEKGEWAQKKSFAEATLRQQEYQLRRLKIELED